VRAPVPMHGKTSAVEHDGKGVFAGLGNLFEAARYHSLVVAEASVPAEREVCARTRGDGIIMGLRHRTYPVHGVQFHPESVLTADGRHMLRNFLAL
jgi:anthranilate synthase/aminodeoxychorismate synthase-like glutamine amidotransferase